MDIPAEEPEPNEKANSPEPYAFDPAPVADAATVIDESARAEGQTLHGLAAPWMNSPAGLQPESFEWHVATTFCYWLDVSHGSHAHQGAELKPVNASDITHGAVPIDSVSDEIVSLWRALAENCTEALPKALLSDLLFAKRVKPASQYVRTAREQYLHAAGQAHLDAMTQAECALRAWTLSRLTRDLGAEVAARAVMWNLLNSQLSTTNTALAGVALPILATLCKSPKDQSVNLSTEEDLKSTLERALVRYPSDNHVDFIASLLIEVSGNDANERTRVNRIRVQQRLDIASATSVGQLKMHWLNEAAKLGQKLGVTDLTSTAIQQMQLIPPDSLEWISVSTDIPIPRYVLELHLRSFTRHGDWRVGLYRWVRTPVPSGRYESNVKMTDEVLKGRIFAQLPTQVFGIHGLPQQEFGQNPEERDHHVRDNEVRRALLQSLVLSDALDAIYKLGSPSQDVMAEFLVKSFRSDRELTITLAKAIQLYWSEEYTLASYLIAPAIEKAARMLLMRLNAPIYRAEKGNSPGQFVGIGTLLPLLEKEGYDRDWIRYHQILLTTAGLNLRNLAMHGFLLNVPREHATLLIRGAAEFILAPTFSDDKDDDEAAKYLTARSMDRPSLLQSIVRAALAARDEFLSSRAR